METIYTCTGELFTVVTSDGSADREFDENSIADFDFLKAGRQGVRVIHGVHICLCRSFKSPVYGELGGMGCLGERLRGSEMLTFPKTSILQRILFFPIKEYDDESFDYAG